MQVYYIVNFPFQGDETDLSVSKYDFGSVVNLISRHFEIVKSSVYFEDSGYNDDDDRLPFPHKYCKNTCYYYKNDMGFLTYFGRCGKRASRKELLDYDED